jgi:uncharacterized protein
MSAMRFAAGINEPLSQSQLYGFLTRPVSDAPVKQGVVLCNPFGQEAVRTHRLYRVIAERLARIGVASIRFDYYGSGDSDGDDEQPLSVATCIENVLSADQHLRALTNCTQVSWFGLRFGAIVAAQASRQCKKRPDRLFVWDLIDDGQRWLDQMREEHQVAITDAFMRNVSPANTGDTAQLSVAFETQGFLVGAELIETMSKFSMTDYNALTCSRLIVLAAGSDQRVLVKGLENVKNIYSFDMHEVSDVKWNTDEAMNSAFVPNDVVNIVLAEMSSEGI